MGYGREGWPLRLDGICLMPSPSLAKRKLILSSMLPACPQPERYRAGSSYCARKAQQNRLQSCRSLGIREWVLQTANQQGAGNTQLANAFGQEPKAVAIAHKKARLPLHYWKRRTGQIVRYHIYLK